MKPGDKPALVALDWGTSSLRAWLLARGEGPAPCIQGQREAPWGIMQLPEGGYPAALEQLCGDWLAAYPDLPLLAAGMVGSAQGWREAPYAPCPAGAADLAGQLTVVPLEGRELGIVPGVLQAGELPNVMRGEETQIMGVLALEDCGEGLFLLPGTHSKWVRVADGAIRSFSTFMTGELFAALSRHTILGRLMAESIDDGEAAFRRGIETALAGGSGGLSALLFTVRALGLTGALTGGQLPDYLSGLLIGHELAGARELYGSELEARPLFLIGAPALCRRYQRALELAALPPGHVLAGASEAGLWAIAQAAGLVQPARN